MRGFLYPTNVWKWPKAAVRICRILRDRVAAFSKSGHSANLSIEDALTIVMTSPESRVPC